jgi:O-antigen ligase
LLENERFLVSVDLATMQFLLFICSQITFKRFLLFWSAVGMLFTHSWFTQPSSPEICNIIAQNCLHICGMLLLVAFLLFPLLIKAKFHLRISAWVIGVILYFLFAATSGFIGGSQGLFMQLVRLAIPMGFGLAILSCFSEKELHKILLCVSIYGIIAAIFSIYLFFTTKNEAEPLFLASGLFTDRNGFSRFLSIVNAYFLITFLSSQKKELKLFLLALLGFVFFSILIQFSRSGYIVYLISSCIAIYGSGSVKAKRIGFILFPLIFVLFGIFILIRINDDKMLVANYSDLTRIYVMKSGINMIKAHPLAGVGFRMSEPRIHEFADKHFPSIVYIKTIHNWYVNVWAELGIIGFLLFCYINASVIYNSYKRYKSVGFINGRYSLFAFIALLVLMIDGLMLPNYDYESIYWIILAVGVVALSADAGPKKALQEMVRLKVQAY